MSRIVHTPLRATKFTLQISGEEYKDFVGSVTEYTHPSVQVAEAIQSGRQVDIPRPGSKIVYSPLAVRHVLDSDMTLYEIIHDWLIFNVTNDAQKTRDITLTIYNANGVPSKNVVFFDAFPSEIGSINFSSTDPNDTYIKVDTVFRYSKFEVKDV